MQKLRALLVSIFVVLLAASCGGSKEIHPEVKVNVTIGQQLIDLKKAHDSGALSDKEYARLKEQLIGSIR